MMRVLTIVVLSMLLFGCGMNEFNGTFVGNGQLTTGQFGGGMGGMQQQEQIRLNMTQDGNAISGNWTSSAGPRGSLSGAADGEHLHFLTLTFSAASGDQQQQMQNCQGSQLQGSGTINNQQLMMTVTGFACGAQINSSINLVRIN